MTNSLHITLRNVTKYYFVDEQRKMTSNGCKKHTNISFGTLWTKLSFAMPAHAIACIIYSCYRSDGFEIWHFHDLSWGKNLLFFVKKKTCLFLSYAPSSTVPIAVFTVNHRCPLKYRTRESEIEQVPIYTSSKEKLKRKKRVINKPLNSSKMVIVLRSIYWNV